MEQSNGLEENAAKKVVEIETEQKSSGQESDQVMKSDPRSDVEQLQQLDKTPVINESSKSENGSMKSRKSVSWSEELVAESPAPRSMPSDDRGLNPYVAYTPAPENNSSSFNVKGQSIFFLYLCEDRDLISICLKDVRNPSLYSYRLW